MTLLSTFRFSLDGTDIATYAQALDRVAGTDGVAGSRSRDMAVSFLHGSWPQFSRYSEPGHTGLTIWTSGTDADGAVTHAEGEQGHLRTNLDLLHQILGRKDAAITVDRYVPKVSGTGTVQRQASAYVARPLSVGGSRGLRTYDVDLVRPYPYWHELPQQLLTGQGAGAFSVSNAGNALIADMEIDFLTGTTPRLTCTDNGDYIEIADALPAGGVRVKVRDSSGQRSVTKITGGASYDAKLRTGKARFMEWPRGTVNLNLSTGTVTLRWYHGWH